MVRAFAHGAMGCRIDPLWWGAGRSSEVEHFLMVQWIVGSILYGGPIELFFIPSSAPRLV